MKDVSPVPPLLVAIVVAFHVPVPMVPTLVSEELTTLEPRFVALRTVVPAMPGIVFLSGG